MNWFRCWTEILDNPKIQRMPGESVKLWLNFLCVARLYDGQLPPLPDLAFKLRCSEQQAEVWLAELVERQLFDRCSDGVFRPHDWDDYQYESDCSTSRTRKFKAEQKRSGNGGGNVPGNGDGNVPETFQGTFLARGREQSRAEQNRTDTSTTEKYSELEVLNTHVKQKNSARAADLDGLVSARWEEFWGKYPRKQRKDFTCQNFISLVTTENESAVFDCLGRYLASDEVARNIVQNPDKWLYEQHRNGWAGDWPKAKTNGAKSEPRLMYS